MRSLVILAALSAFSTPALADDAHKLQAALRANDGTLTDLFADHVQVQIGIDEPSCKQLAGSVTREQLLPCLHALGGKYPIVFTPGPLASTPVLYGVENLVYALTLKSGKVVSVMPVLTNAADAKLPTTLGSNRLDFTPSPKLAAAIKNAGRDIKALYKICYDADGTVTNRRLVTASKLAAFDKEAFAVVAQRKVVKPAAPFGTAIAACDVITILPPLDHSGEEAGEAGGVEGGVGGGDPDGISHGPPPPPPPPPPPGGRPQVVSPTMLEGSRIAGEKRITPDDATKTDIAASGKSKIVGSYKLCVDVAGAITAVTQLKSTGFPAYDGKIITTIRETWRYKPYEVNGHTVPVCTAVTFIYSQDLPAAPPPKP